MKNYKQIIAFSILDRLIDRQPNQKHESSKSLHQQMKELHTSIRRDLENLLNTRRPELKWPKEWKTLDRSLVAYGIPDITGKILDTASAQEAFCLELRAIIARFETRLSDIKVKLLQSDQSQDRTLRLRIEALLMLEDTTECIVFDSIFESELGYFEITEAYDER